MRTPEDLGARIDEAKELWDMRREVARGQLIAKLSLDDEQAERLGAALQAMNERLAQTFAAIPQNLDGDVWRMPEARPGQPVAETLSGNVCHRRLLL